MMAQHLFIFLFFTGAIPCVLCVPRKYYLIQQGKTWNEARAYCRAYYTDLAIIASNEDMVQFQNEIQIEQFNSRAWIGLYREHIEWYWSMQNERVGSMRPWASEQPDNWYASEWCGMIWTDGWNDGECTSLFPFVCFDERKSGNQRYIYISNVMSWHHAQVYCRNHYTDLASARDETENSVIQGLTSDWTWFGLTRESWKWINQTTFSTISWMSGEPDFIKGNETCGYINNGQAGDEMCSEIMPFFCYREITGQLIMKMEVRSNRDMNDPAVMDAIMEKVKQKLKEHGLAEKIYIKWRVQPDGKVFYKKKEKK